MSTSTDFFEIFVRFLKDKQYKIVEGNEENLSLVDPYQLYSEWLESINHRSGYDPEFGDEELCDCGHRYYRHFDSYADMEPVGCKYCPCDKFTQESNEFWVSIENI